MSTEHYITDAEIEALKARIRYYRDELGVGYMDNVKVDEIEGLIVRLRKAETELQAEYERQAGVDF